MRIHVLTALAFLSACADQHLDEAEQLPIINSVTSTTTLEGLSKYGHDLSRAYTAAAAKTRDVQDVESFLIFLAAGSTVKGLISSASNTVLANRALAGAAVQQASKRTVPRSAIDGIYTGAKRLNCISTVAQMGVSILGATNDTIQIRAARALTYGAYQEVRITTREALVRDVADYSGLVTDLTPSDYLPTADIQAMTIGGGDSTPTVTIDGLTYYAEQIEFCLAGSLSEAGTVSGTITTTKTETTVTENAAIR